MAIKQNDRQKNGSKRLFLTNQKKERNNTLTINFR